MCSVCTTFEERMAAGNVLDPFGAVAQLVERVHGMDEAAGSKPAGSTSTSVSPWALGALWQARVALHSVARAARREWMEAYVCVSSSSSRWRVATAGSWRRFDRNWRSARFES